MSALPLVSGLRFDQILAWRPTGPVTVGEFVADARAVAAMLPAGEWVLNLCDDRYHFAVLFAACLIAGKTSLQPASHSGETMLRLAQAHSGAYGVVDAAQAPTAVPQLRFPDLRMLDRPAQVGIPMVAADRIAAILFTSGSTGLPQPHVKTWGKLVRNGLAEAAALGLIARPPVLVGTVPAQHSYGFESTFLLALHGGCGFWSGKPFYPQDVVDALLAVPRPRMLVTTPYHLATLLASDLDWPVLDICLSATAPLSAELAAAAERRGGAPVHEIYGSTESGQLACRRTTDGPSWYLLPGVILEQENGTTHASGGHVEGRVALSDVIEMQAQAAFLLHGRHADLVSIAGKRSSLSYLNHQLRAIDGVDDGAFFMPDSDGHDTDNSGGLGGVSRLAAFVVAPDLTREGLLAVLRERIDALFLPRPLVLIDTLPRDAVGKLPRAALQMLYRQWETDGCG